MNCHRFDLRRRFVRYLHGELSSQSSKRIEAHLRKCEHCSASMEKLKATHNLAANLPAMELKGDLWREISASISLGRRAPSTWMPWVRTVAIGFAVVFTFVFAVAFWKQQSRELYAAHLELENYRQVPIQGMLSTQEPHVFTEGYVSEVRMEEDDGDVVFKLVENLDRPAPFVICEVIDGLKVPLPPLGSKVRVYGVSRYDSKSDHEWPELHPVLNIQVLKP